jgi:hypothetical protein
MCSATSPVAGLGVALVVGFIVAMKIHSQQMGIYLEWYAGRGLRDILFQRPLSTSKRLVRLGFCSASDCLLLAESDGSALFP